MRIIAVAAFSLLAAACTAPKTEEYHLAKTVAIEGSGGWDYVKVDKVTRRVYVTHDTKVEVLDADSGQQVGSINGLHGVHGLAFAHDLGRGFISNGKSNSVTIFDLKTGKILGKVKTGKKPDALAYDDMTHRLLAFNGEDASATVIDGKTGKNVGTIALGAGPEFAAPDDKGHVFVNLEDTGETLMLDVANLTVMKRWTVTPGASPSSLAMDRVNHRLFIGCRNKLLVVMDAQDGHIVTSLPIGEHVDATAFDPQTKLIISSTGDGTLSIIKQDDADHYHVAQTIVTHIGSRTFGLDAMTHRLFVPAADFSLPPAKPTKENPKRRPSVILGTFSVLVYDKQ